MNDLERYLEAEAIAAQMRAISDAMGVDQADVDALLESLD